MGPTILGYYAVFVWRPMQENNILCNGCIQHLSHMRVQKEYCIQPLYQLRTISQCIWSLDISQTL
jgi:hypothetical protein